MIDERRRIYPRVAFEKGEGVLSGLDGSSFPCMDGRMMDSRLLAERSKLILRGVHRLNDGMGHGFINFIKKPPRTVFFSTSVSSLQAV